ncbi:MAG TPA: alkaline phosphatase family protein [Pyrinomonadaceae bacterium]
MPNPIAIKDATALYTPRILIPLEALMFHIRRHRTLGAWVRFSALSSIPASAADIKTVFVIAMENHNWTQPAQVAGKIQQVYQNPNAPFINALVGGTAAAIINGEAVNISEQTAYAAAYHNVLATPGGNNPQIHPSEPNYLWAEAGTNFGVLNDNEPFRDPGGTNQNTSLHLSALLQTAGKTWKSYQEDIDLTPDASNKLTNVPLPPDQWTVPLKNRSGVFSSGVNAFNGSSQYDYAAKHNPMVFFTDTNGGNNPTPSNALSAQYAPLQQLFIDLANNTVADYNWITPNQHNDMHTSLTGGYKGLTGDSANIKQGDDFLSQIVPMIMASDAYKNHGVIVLWWDESEGGDTPSQTLPFIIISRDARENAGGKPYSNTVAYSHSSFLRTMQEIFRVDPGRGYPWLGDAMNANDLSDLFRKGAIK